jgi:hypothetical protein
VSKDTDRTNPSAAVEGTAIISTLSGAAAEVDVESWLVHADDRLRELYKAALVDPNTRNRLLTTPRRQLYGEDLSVKAMLVEGTINGLRARRTRPDVTWRCGVTIGGGRGRHLVLVRRRHLGVGSDRPCRQGGATAALGRHSVGGGWERRAV